MSYTLDDMIKAFKAGTRCKEKKTEEEITKILVNLEDTTLESFVEVRRLWKEKMRVEGKASHISSDTFSLFLDKNYDKPIPKKK